MGNRIHWIRSVLRTTPQRWISLAETLPPALLLRAPAQIGRAHV